MPDARSAVYCHQIGTLFISRNGKCFVYECLWMVEKSQIVLFESIRKIAIYWLLLRMIICISTFFCATVLNSKGISTVKASIQCRKPSSKFPVIITRSWLVCLKNFSLENHLRSFHQNQCLGQSINLADCSFLILNFCSQLVFINQLTEYNFIMQI